MKRAKGTFEKKTQKQWQQKELCRIVIKRAVSKPGIYANIFLLFWQHLTADISDTHQGCILWYMSAYKIFKMFTK